MKRARCSIGQLAVILAVLALNLAVFRELTRNVPGSNQIRYLVPLDATHSMAFIVFALGVLPMASVLIPAAIFQAMRARREGASSARWLGFVSFGGLSVFAFMAISSLSPSGVNGYVSAIGQVVGPALESALGDLDAEQEWIGWVIESALLIVAFGLPELLVALAGARLVGGAGRRVSLDVVRAEGREPSPSPGLATAVVNA